MAASQHICSFSGRSMRASPQTGRPGVASRAATTSARRTISPPAAVTRHPPPLRRGHLRAAAAMPHRSARTLTLANFAHACVDRCSPPANRRRCQPQRGTVIGPSRCGRQACRLVHSRPQHGRRTGSSTSFTQSSGHASRGLAPERVVTCRATSCRVSQPLLAAAANRPLPSRAQSNLIRPDSLRARTTELLTVARGAWCTARSHSYNAGGGFCLPSSKRPRGKWPTCS